MKWRETRLEKKEKERMNMMEWKIRTCQSDERHGGKNVANTSLVQVSTQITKNFKSLPNLRSLEERTWKKLQKFIA